MSASQCNDNQKDDCHNRPVGGKYILFIHRAPVLMKKEVYIYIFAFFVFCLFFIEYISKVGGLRKATTAQ